MSLQSALERVYSLYGTRLVVAEFNEVRQEIVALQGGFKVQLLC